jgi:hypothetical protein
MDRDLTLDGIGAIVWVDRTLWAVDQKERRGNDGPLKAAPYVLTGKSRRLSSYEGKEKAPFLCRINAAVSGRYLL